MENVLVCFRIQFFDSEFGRKEAVSELCIRESFVGTLSGRAYGYICDFRSLVVRCYNRPRNKHGCVFSIISGLYALHGLYVILVLDSRNIVFCLGSARISNIVRGTRILCNRAVPVILGNLFFSA